MSKGLTAKPNTMLDDFGFEIYEENTFPIAYLLTFRTYGTWLHGDERGSVRRNGNNLHQGPQITASVPLLDAMAETQKRPTFVLSVEQRECVEAAIREVCEFRDYLLRAQNVRRNHAHAVVSAAIKPEKIVNEFKAYGTKRLRAEGLCSSTQKIWSRGASTRYLWKPRQVDGAVDYVKYCQEDIPCEFRDWPRFGC